jgi:hypothetical protein
MDREMENSTSTQTTTALLAGHKFLEPLSARRNEHERCRKQIKETWHRELKRMQESVSNLRKAKALYVQRQQEWERAKEAALKAESAAEASSSSSLASYNPAGSDYHQSSSSANQQQQHQLQHSSSTVGLLSSSLSTSSILLAASGGSSSSKVDKRKRTEEDALQKVRFLVTKNKTFGVALSSMLHVISRFCFSAVIMSFVVIVTLELPPLPSSCVCVYTNTFFQS